MLEALNLECVRGERTLFSGVSFALERGTMLRVTGANGSGKTSLLRIVCGLMLPAQGDVHWNGGNIRALREDYWKDLSYVGHLNAVKDDLTALENIEIGAALAGRDVTHEAALLALDQLDIAHCAELPARVLSQGQRRRIALARLIVWKAAPLWVLDEPFPGLDTNAVDFLSAAIGTHVRGGGSVILTTHQEVAINVAGEQRIELGA